MEVFAYNPAAKNESVADFNERMAAFCLENPVVDITVSTAGPAICLSLTLAEDAEIDSAVAIVPTVTVLEQPQLLQLERSLGDAVAAVAATDSDDAPAQPFKVTLHEAGAVVYAVILTNAGEIELDVGDDVDERGDK